MNKKRVINALVVLIGLGIFIMFSAYAEKNGSFVESSIENPDIEKSTGFMDSILHEIQHELICFEYPDIVFYPKMRQFNISVTTGSSDMVYCIVSANLGSTSKSRIFLGRESANQITYYVPDNFDVLMFDTISFKFYDEYSRLIDDSKLIISYDEEEKQIQVFDAHLSDGGAGEIFV